MQEFPHHYHVTTHAEATGDIVLTSTSLDPLRTQSPVEFGGPGDRWSPETLLTGAVGDCFALTFRAVARASRLPWTSLRCGVTGTLERVGSVPQFTGFDVVAHLEVPEGTSVEAAQEALERAERHCLVSSSLRGPVHLRASVEASQPSPAFG